MPANSPRCPSQSSTPQGSCGCLPHRPRQSSAPASIDQRSCSSSGYSRRSLKTPRHNPSRSPRQASNDNHRVKCQEFSSVIALDLDEVLLDCLGGLRRFYQEFYPHKPLPGLKELKIILDDVSSEVRNAYLASAMYKELLPISGAVDGVRKLHAKGHRLEVVTARDAAQTPIVWALIEKHFLGMISAIHITSGHPKGHLCKAFGAWLVIDDSFLNVSEAAGFGLSAVLFGDYPWNQVQSLPLDVVHLHDWADIVDWVFEVDKQVAARSRSQSKQQERPQQEQDKDGPQQQKDGLQQQQERPQQPKDAMLADSLSTELKNREDAYIEAQKMPGPILSREKVCAKAMETYATHLGANPITVASRVLQSTTTPRIPGATNEPKSKNHPCIHRVNDSIRSATAYPKSTMPRCKSTISPPTRSATTATDPKSTITPPTFGLSRKEVRKERAKKSSRGSPGARQVRSTRPGSCHKLMCLSRGGSGVARSHENCTESKLELEANTSPVDPTRRPVQDILNVITGRTDSPGIDAGAVQESHQSCQETPEFAWIYPGGQSVPEFIRLVKKYQRAGGPGVDAETSQELRQSREEEPGRSRAPRSRARGARRCRSCPDAFRPPVPADTRYGDKSPFHERAGSLHSSPRTSKPEGLASVKGAVQVSGEGQDRSRSTAVSMSMQKGSSTQQVNKFTSVPRVPTSALATSSTTWQQAKHVKPMFCSTLSSQVRRSRPSSPDFTSRINTVYQAKHVQSIPCPTPSTQVPSPRPSSSLASDPTSRVITLCTGCTVYQAKQAQAMLSPTPSSQVRSSRPSSSDLSSRVDTVNVNLSSPCQVNRANLVYQIPSPPHGACQSSQDITVYRDKSPLRQSSRDVIIYQNTYRDITVCRDTSPFDSQHQISRTSHCKTTSTSPSAGKREAVAKSSGRRQRSKPKGYCSKLGYVSPWLKRQMEDTVVELLQKVDWKSCIGEAMCAEVHANASGGALLENANAEELQRNVAKSSAWQEERVRRDELCRENALLWQELFISLGANEEEAATACRTEEGRQALARALTEKAPGH